MVLLRIDPHKDTHTAVAVDQAGRQLGPADRRRPAPSGTPSCSAGHAAAGPSERHCAVQDCRHVTRRLDATCWPPGSRWCGWRPG